MPKNPKVSSRQSKSALRRESRSLHSVGYGKPPIHSRFAPGKSGNPKGRPKGQLNLETELKNELSRLITVREGDRSRRLKKGVAWPVKTVNGALNNDPKANATLIALLRTLILSQQPQGAAEGPVTSNDRDLLADFIRRHGDLTDHDGGGADADSPQSREPKKTG
jgi:uncharacterized protein DUF5681